MTITVDKEVKKPARTGVRARMQELAIGEFIELTEVAKVKDNREAPTAAATRVSAKLRRNNARSVYDVRQKTGRTFLTNSSSVWNGEDFVCTLQIIRMA